MTTANEDLRRRELAEELRRRRIAAEIGFSTIGELVAGELERLRQIGRLHE
jgi:hypothetical protein